MIATVLVATHEKNFFVLRAALLREVESEEKKDLSLGPNFNADVEVVTAGRDPNIRARTHSSCVTSHYILVLLLRT